MTSVTAHLSTSRASMDSEDGTSLLTTGFERSTWQQIERALSAPRSLWTTDADGTLWRDDIGEGFLKQLIADNALVSPEARDIDVWQSYEQRVARDKGAGYAWAAQVMAGMSEAEVDERAAAFARTFVPAHLHPEMSALVDEARARSCETWIVSASARWIVAAAARVLGLSPDHVLGMAVTVHDGRLTSDIILPITYKSGKVDAISQHIGRTPTLASGDSDGDVEMLRAASLGLLVVHPRRTSPTLLAEAGAGGWLTHMVADVP